MATYSAGVALAFDYEALNGTTGSFSPSGDDLALITFISSLNFGGAPNITDCKYGGSGGTSLTEVGADYSWYSGNGRLVSYEAAPGPSGSTTSFGEWDSNPLQSAIASLSYSGVDPTTPVEGATDNSGSSGGVTTTVASVTVAGCTVGQTIIACVTANSDGVNLAAFSAVSGTTLRHSDVTGTFLGIAVLEKVATGSSETLEVNANCSSSATLTWAARGLRVNDAAASGSTGTVAYTNANDTSAASGTTTVTGALARTNANDTLAASGEIGTEITGALATTNANDTSAASGTTTVVGTLAITNANDTSSAAGTTTVAGTLATTNSDDTATASGVAGSPTGTVSYTNANDTSAAQGETPQQTSGAPGGRPWIAYINGRRVTGSLWELQRLIEELAEEQAEKAVEKGEEPKKPRIVVQPGKAVAKMPELTQEQGKAIQHNIRAAYNEAYIRAKIKYAEHEAEEEATMMVLLS